MENTNLVKPGGGKVSGKELVNSVKKMMRYERILDHLGKRKMDKELIRAFILEDKVIPENLKKKKQKELNNILSNIETYLKNFVPELSEVRFKLDEDTEHEGTRIICHTKRNGAERESVFDLEFVLSAEFSELRALYGELRDLGDSQFILKNGDEDVSLRSFGEVIEFLLNQGRKGKNIQRYKGLGEMDPEQLWDTTMDPEKRTLLQVNVEDSVGADEIFTILMGDQVEQRRVFIKKHALDVRNLDI